MTFENMNTDDFFPLLQQTLSDTFKIDSYLMHAPYQDFEKMDMGLRRMVWGDYKTNSPLFSLSGSSPYQIIVLQSSLGFYNVIVSLTTDAAPDILGIMPFLSEPINQVTINRLMRDNHIDPKYSSVLSHFYYSLPIVDIDELTLMLQHFIGFFIPAFKTCSIEYVNYKTEPHNTSPNEERFQKFSSDYIAELISRLEHCCRAMTAGNTAQAIDSMKKAMETASASGQSTQRTRSGRKGPDHFEWSNKKNEATSFEDMLNKFKQSSDEKMSALKKGLESKRGGFSRHGSGQSR